MSVKYGKVIPLRIDSHNGKGYMHSLSIWHCVEPMQNYK